MVLQAAALVVLAVEVPEAVLLQPGEQPVQRILVEVVAVVALQALVQRVVAAS